MTVPEQDKDKAQLRQSRLLAAILVVIMPIVLVVTGLNLILAIINNSLIGAEYLAPPTMALFFAIAYTLNRIGRYTIAVGIVLTCILLGFVALAYLDMQSVLATGRIPRSGILHLFGFLLSVFLSSILLSRKYTLLVAAAGFVAIQVLAAIFSEVPFTTFVLVSSYYTVLSLLLFVFMSFRNGVERDHQAELRALLHDAEQANAELKQANIELKRAKAMAQESARLKSEFLNTMSHELRTPLNAIGGFTGIMLSGMGGEIDEDAEHMVKRIQVNSERLLTLINDILDVAKIEAGRLELAEDVIELRELVQQWHTANQVLADQKGLRFLKDVARNVPEKVIGDSSRLTQIATNLISNAIKFTQEGEVHVAVRWDNHRVVLSVSDTGVGIPPHAINYIFEEFRQVDGSSRRVYGGSGLGLAIVRNLVQVMGGQITVESELGKGSTFTVLLPLQTVQIAETVEEG